MKKLILWPIILVILLAAYLLFWPVPIKPVSWSPPEAPDMTGPYAVNQKLATVERLGEGIGIGPEDVAMDRLGRVYVGYEDGRILRFDTEIKQYDTFYATGGRPLGLAFARDGRLLVADAIKGLLAVSEGGHAEVLATEADGLPFKFTDDLDVGPDGTVYFSDASSRFSIDGNGALADIMEHGGNGRLLRYDPKTDKTDVLMAGLQFANGIAVGPDGKYVLVNETGAYRVTRYWLKGDKAGQHDVFIDNLPGLPDNINYHARTKTFWLALYSPRSPDLDNMADNPFLRKVAWRLPAAFHPRPPLSAFVLGLNTDGKVIHNLQHQGPDAYAPITSVNRFGDWLYFGSLSQPAFARLPAPGSEQPVNP